MLASVLVASRVLGNGPRLSRPRIDPSDRKGIADHLAAGLLRAEKSGRLGSAALVLVNDCRITAERGFGTTDRSSSRPVDPGRTRFRVASVSKAVTSWGILKLVEEGRITLDEPVLPRLRRWRFPGSGAHGEQVSIRHLLSHTAGLDDGLGYVGFLPGQRVQTLEQSLLGAGDSTSGSPRPAVVARRPGDAMAYSGAGYTILELLVEELTHRPFHDYMDLAVLKPLGMVDSTFDPARIEEWRGAGLVAPDYDRRLTPQPFRRYAIRAAVNLHATPRDLARFAMAFCADGRDLRRETLAQMTSPQPGTSGSWGLGLTLFVPTRSGYVVGHDGGSVPATGAVLRIHPATGNALVLTLSGGRVPISRMGDDWTFWETGVLSAGAQREELYAWLRVAPWPLIVGALCLVARYVHRRTRRALERGTADTPGELRR
jgi:CubicO group peptidase (beta-lactamase class C family)